MLLKTLDKQDLDDFEHRVTKRIKDFSADDRFPQMENYKVTRRMLDDYLFDKQAVLDSKGSERTQLTVAGTLIVLPIIVLSAIPEQSYPFGHWTFLVFLAIGVLLALTVRAVIRLLIRIRLRRLSNPVIDRFINDVLNYEP
ncbi:MAG: hypothetical protein LKH27_06785 [Prevotella sp.]|jgi:hypothetical protein|nr:MULTISPECIES: hypothetical protein [unclassified Prevotella]MCH3971008.1 hypothetical protein [Prevotella sp.]MCH3985612.1 hypothetical protein [Prevotella sp.]MCH3993147.1 hypothetical protein [Prevotella sp.]MCH4185839.1 hypothetical protein [Prevotella sp.]MCH4215723.1 hypothetical protein [Prevotella sp.]